MHNALAGERALPPTWFERVAMIVRAAQMAERWQWWILGALTLPYVWLIWSVPYLPMQDMPGHIELSFLHQRVRAGDPAYSPFYTLAPQPWPNSLSTLLLGMFGDALGLTVAVKVLLSLYALAWPLSLGGLARALKRPPLVAMFAVPTILDFNWAIGFFNYLLAKPLMIASLSVACAFATKPKRTSGAVLLALLVLTFLTHALAYGITMAGVCFAIVYFARGWRRVLGLWPVALAGLVPLRYLRAQAAAPPPTGGWVMYDFNTGFAWFWTHLGDLNDSNGEEWGYTLSFALWLLALGLLQHAPSTSPANERSSQHSLFLWLSGFVMFVAYGWGPAHMPNVDIICPRVLVLAWVLMLLMPTRLPAGLLRRVLVVGMFGTVLVHTYTTHAAYKRFNELEMGDFEGLMRMVPSGKTLSVHYFRTTSPYGKHASLWHWGKLYGVWQGGGGHTDDSFAARSTSFVTITAQARSAGTYDQDPGLDPQRLRSWDYLLLCGGTAEVAFAAIAPSVARYVASSAEWHLFQIRR